MKKTTFLIAGKHAVTEALKNPKRKVFKIFLTEDSKKNLNKDNPQFSIFTEIKNFEKYLKPFLNNFEQSLFEDFDQNANKNI